MILCSGVLKPYFQQRNIFVSQTTKDTLLEFQLGKHSNTLISIKIFENVISFLIKKNIII